MQHWDCLCNWYMSSWKTHLSSIFNIMTADDLATKAIDSVYLEYSAVISRRVSYYLDQSRNPCPAMYTHFMVYVSMTMRGYNFVCFLNRYSHTLSHEYQVAGNRCSRLLLSSENHLYANLCVQEQSKNMTSQCYYPRSCDVTVVMPIQKGLSLTKMLKGAINDCFSGFVCSISV